MAEHDLIQQARRGDTAAWEALTRDHQQPVFRLAYLLLGDPDDAEDTAQEAFIRAWYALGSFDVARPLRPWLLGITANLAKNKKRWASRQFGALMRLARGEPASYTAPDSDDARQLWQAVQRLKPEFQEVLYMRFFLEMTEAEMSAALDVAAGTVKSRLHRGLDALRAVVRRDFPHLKDAIT